MRTTLRSTLLSATLGLSLVFGVSGSVLAQEQQSPSPLTASSVSVDGTTVRIVGLDQNGREQVIMLDLTHLNASQRQALGIPISLDEVPMAAGICGAGTTLGCPMTADTQTTGAPNLANVPGTIPSNPVHTTPGSPTNPTNPTNPGMSPGNPGTSPNEGTSAGTIPGANPPTSVTAGTPPEVNEGTTVGTIPSLPGGTTATQGAAVQVNVDANVGLNTGSTGVGATANAELGADTGTGLAPAATADVGL